MTIVAGILVGLAGMIGFALTLVGLSGVWLTVLAIVVHEWLVPGTYSMWTILAAVALGFLGEVAEFVAGSVGAAKAGGTKRAAVGALVGGLVGGVLGTPIFPIVGTVVGAVVGAGAGAAMMHKTREDADWRQTWKVGQGAAIGRLVATAIKAFFALVVAVLAVVAAFA